MEQHILPTDDRAVFDLSCDIIETLKDCLQTRHSISQSSETGEPIIDLLSGELGGNRRFRLQFIEILPC